MKDYIKIGKKISYLLRHNPENLIMDKNGYVKIKDLLYKLNITQEDLDYIVENNDKKRYSYSPDKKKIRAAQGHSISVDVEALEKQPPDILFCGTSYDNFRKIKESGGLEKMKRLHVHLTEDYDTAYTVGKRHSRDKQPLILEIKSSEMYNDGFKFYLSANNVWLIDNVPIKYVKVL